MVKRGLLKVSGALECCVESRTVLGTKIRVLMKRLFARKAQKKKRTQIRWPSIVNEIVDAFKS